MSALGVPGYDVWGVLGEGGMSEVWLAKHQGLAVPVVVKTLKRALREQAGLDASTRVKSEARLMARVGVAAVRDVPAAGASFGGEGGMR